MGVTSAIFLKKIDSVTQSDPKFGQRAGVISMQAAKDPEHCSSLLPSEKELLVRSVSKIPLGVTINLFSFTKMVDKHLVSGEANGHISGARIFK
jgi:hypothetical protein